MDSNLDTLVKYDYEIEKPHLVVSSYNDDNNKSNIDKAISDKSIESNFVSKVNYIDTIDKVANNNHINELEAFIADGDDDGGYDSFDDTKNHTTKLNEKSLIEDKVGSSDGIASSGQIGLSRNNMKPNKLSRNVFNVDDDDDDEQRRDNNFILDDEIDVKINFDKIPTVKDNKTAASLNIAISQIMSSFQQQIETGDTGYSNMNDDDEDDGKKKKKKRNDEDDDDDEDDYDL